MYLKKLTVSALVLPAGRLLSEFHWATCDDMVQHHCLVLVRNWLGITQDRVSTTNPGKTHPWTNASARGNFRRTFRTIGPYEFPQEKVWTNDWSIWISPEISMDQWRSKLSESFSLDRYWSIDPNPQVCWFYFLNLAQKEKFLLRKPDSPYQGSGSLGNCSGGSFCPKQVLLSKNFRSRPGCGWKILSKEFWGGGGGQNLILNHGRLLQDWQIPKSAGERAGKSARNWGLLGDCWEQCRFFASKKESGCSQHCSQQSPHRGQNCYKTSFQKCFFHSFCNYYKNTLHLARKRSQKYCKNNCFRELFCNRFLQDGVLACFCVSFRSFPRTSRVRERER